MSFDTNVRQMTEMFQRPKCLNKKWRKCFSEKKNSSGELYPTVIRST